VLCSDGGGAGEEVVRLTPVVDAAVVEGGDDGHVDDGGHAGALLEHHVLPARLRHLVSHLNMNIVVSYSGITMNKQNIFLT